MKNITPLELKSWIDKDKAFILIDVREQWEHDAYNIGGQLIPVNELTRRISEIPTTGDIVLYCEKGIRSVIAIQKLEIKGLTNIYNLSGGMKRWKEEIK
ncbi:MAG: rhodanese-like domain-containing protein [Flavipsychrobacter sp.]